MTVDPYRLRLGNRVAAVTSFQTNLIIALATALTAFTAGAGAADVGSSGRHGFPSVHFGARSSGSRERKRAAGCRAVVVLASATSVSQSSGGVPWARRSANTRYASVVRFYTGRATARH